MAKAFRSRRFFIPALALGLLGAGLCLAQDWTGGWRYGEWGHRPGERDGTRVWIEGGGWVDESTVKTARETASHSTGTPTWENPKGFENDVFTFARAIFYSERRSADRKPVFGWFVDYPDADLNLSYRLQQITSMKVDPDGRVLHLTDADLPDFPFIYMVHTEDMLLRDDEAAALGKYLHNGGALLVADFWNSMAWKNFAEEMTRVLPGKSWVDLPMDHPIFHCVYKIPGTTNDLQIPTMQYWMRDHDPKNPGARISTLNRGPGSEEVHVRALLDEHDRIMVLALHNTDLSDGWEREGEAEDYFRQFSEKRAYPLAINLIFYLMTH